MDPQAVKRDLEILRETGMLDEINRLATSAYIKGAENQYRQNNQMAAPVQRTNREEKHRCPICGGKFTVRNKSTHMNTGKHRQATDVAELRTELQTMKEKHDEAQHKIVKLLEQIQDLKIARDALVGLISENKLAGAADQ